MYRKEKNNNRHSYGQANKQLKVHKFSMELMEKSVIVLGLRTLPLPACRRCGSSWWCRTVVSRHMEFRLLRWLDNVLDWQKPLPHTGHLNGFSLTCMYLRVTGKKKKKPTGYYITVAVHIYTTLRHAGGHKLITGKHDDRTMWT